MYSNVYNQQAMIDRINLQIQELEKTRSQLQQPNSLQPSINQTFQLAPNSTGGIKYADTLEEVQKEMIYQDTPIFSKNMSVVWIKKVNGDIKTYSLTEIVAKDDKDIQIECLLARVEELERGRKYEYETNSDDSITKSVEDEKPSSVSTIRAVKKK